MSSLENYKTVLQTLNPHLYATVERNDMGALDNRITLRNISNLAALPDAVVALIASTDEIRVASFFEIHGYKNRELMWAAGFDSDDKRYYRITSIGGDVNGLNVQWSSEKGLRLNVKN